MAYREFKFRTDRFHGLESERQNYITMLLATISRFGYFVGFSLDGSLLIREEIEDNGFIEETLTDE